jgi:hypothetical protein
MEESDLWRIAAMLFQKHGEDAETYAHLRADEAYQQGNIVSCEAWECVAAVIHKLDRRPTSKLHVH